MRRLAIAFVVAIPLAMLWIAGGAGLGRLLFSMGYTSLAATILQDPAWTGYGLAREKRWEDAAAAFGAAPSNAYNRGNALALSHHYHEAIDAYDDALDLNPDDEDARFNKELIRRVLAAGAVDAGPSKGTANATANKEHHGKSADQHDGETSSSGNGYVGNQEGASASGAQGGSKVSRVGKGDASSNASGEGKATGSASKGAGIGRSGGDLADVTAVLAENQRKVVRGHIDQGIVPSVDWLKTLPDDPGLYLKLRIMAEQKQRAGATAAAPQGDDD